MTDQTTWYNIQNIDELDTPALVVYSLRVKQNIQQLIGAIDHVNRLRPHIKTHKTKEVIAILQKFDVHKFKSATITETELLGICGAKDVLLAYQPVGIKLQRFLKIKEVYPKTHFSCLVDSIEVAQEMCNIAQTQQINLDLYIDLNLGMNRTGITPIKAEDLILAINKLPFLKVEGLHLYDGNIRDTDFEVRKNKCDIEYRNVEILLQNLEKQGITNLKIVAGGTPTFPVHSQRKNIDCSPGTFVFWDKGYQDSYPEQDFKTAALVISRVISLPDKDKICLDLGHKSIAAENELSKRVYFLNAPNVVFVSQSEEHLVLGVSENHSYKIGDIFYGLPIHICPTVALYNELSIVENENLTGETWQVIARNRQITI